MRLSVKICGVTRREDIEAAVRAGADALGFVFAESPRRIDVERARSLAADLPLSVSRVAVFRHPRPEEVALVLERFAPDVVQSEPDDALNGLLSRGVTWLQVLHGDDPLPERSGRETPTSVLLEAPGRGGRGIRADWDRAAELAREVPLILAGGLSPDNVAQAIRRVRPRGVDVSSGVERAPGVKDPARIERFLEEVRRVERELIHE
jgi:phosphoribosylanthranilate isomerase